MAGTNDYQDTAIRRVIDTVNAPGIKVEEKFDSQQVLGHVQAGQRWFFDSLIEAGVTRVKTELDISLGPSFTTWSTADFFRDPIQLWEKSNGTTGDWVHMVNSPIPPNAPIQVLRIWWDYYEGVMHFNQSTVTSSIRVQFYTDTIDLYLPYDKLVVKGSMDAITNYATALALASVGRSGASQMFMDLAKQAMTRWINMDIHVQQQTPARQYRPGPQNWLYNYWL